MRKDLEGIIKQAELEITDTGNVFKVRHRIRFFSEISRVFIIFFTLFAICDGIFVKTYFESKETMLEDDWFGLAILLGFNLCIILAFVYYIWTKKDFIEVSNHMVRFRYRNTRKEYFFERGMRVKMISKKTSSEGKYKTYYFREVEIHLVMKGEEFLILFFLVKEKYATKAKVLGQFITNQINERIKKNRY